MEIYTDLESFGSLQYTFGICFSFLKYLLFSSCYLWYHHLYFYKEKIKLPAGCLPLYYPSTFKLLITVQHRALEFFALRTVSASPFQAWWPRLNIPSKVWHALHRLVLSLDGFRSGVYLILLGEETAFSVTLHIPASTWLPLEQSENGPFQGGLCVLSMFLEDQREGSCPLQDQHLLPFGHSAPSLLTLYLKNKSPWGGSKDSEMLMGFGILWVSDLGKYTFGKFELLTVPFPLHSKSPTGL